MIYGSGDVKSIVVITSRVLLWRLSHFRGLYNNNSDSLLYMPPIRNKDE